MTNGVAWLVNGHLRAGVPVLHECPKTATQTPGYPRQFASSPQMAYPCIMQCVFATEPLSQTLFDEALPLLREHWREVAHFPDIELEPDMRLYQAAADAGILRFFTMRSDRLTGYAVFFVRPNPHYKQSLQAAQDVLYVDKRYRGLTSAKFIRFCDAQLQAESVEVVRHHLKAAHNHERLMARLGYEVEDIIYVRRLNNGSDRGDTGDRDLLSGRGEPAASESEGRSEPVRAGAEGSVRQSRHAGAGA